MTDIKSMLRPEQREALFDLAIRDAAAPLTDEDIEALNSIDTVPCGAMRCKTACDGFIPSGVKQDGFVMCVCSHSKQAHTGRRITLTVGQDLNAEPLDWDRVRLVEAPVTTINGVEVDLRGAEGQTHDTPCADCTTPLSVVILPEGVDIAVLTEHPRTAVCAECGTKRVEGKQGVLVHDARPTTKEEPVLDLTNFTNAQLAEAAGKARDLMAAEEAEALAERREQAVEQEAERQVVDKAQMKRDRADQGKRKKWMGEFSAHGVTVPALDFSEVNLDEIVPPKVRSPYNKVLHRSEETRLDPEAATYRLVRETHKRLFKLHGKKAKGQRLVAVLEPDAKAKVEAFAKITGKTYDEARDHLVAIGVL